MESLRPQHSAESDPRAHAFVAERARSGGLSNGEHHRAPGALTVAIADETDIIHHGLRRMLSDQMDMAILWESVTAEQTISMIRRSPPKVLLLDPSLAHICGSETVSFVTDRGMGVVLLAKEHGRHLHSPLPDHALRLDSGAGRFELSRTIHAACRAATQQRRTPARSAEQLSEFEKERQILVTMAAGCTNRQIARSLGLSEDQVKAYLKALFARWHVSSRSEAVVRAIRLGVIE